MREIKKPAYYDTFVCTADRCDFTCCQQWKIGVDDATDKVWKKTAPPVDEELKELDPKKNLHYYTTTKDGDRVICLNGSMECPFLKSNKLCSLYIAYGEQMLSETCRTFPREIHKWEDREEYALMPSCPAVIDILAKQDRVEIISTDDSVEKKIEDEDLKKVRDFLFHLVCENQGTVRYKLMILFYMVLDLLEQTYTEGYPISETLEVYFKENLWKEVEKTIDTMRFEVLDSFDERCELLLDLAENYRKQGLYKIYLEPLCEAAEQWLEQADDHGDLPERIKGFNELLKNHDKLLQNLLCQEIYSDLILPEDTLEDLVMKLQWIAMEYAMIYQAALLTYLKKGELSYKDLRDVIVLTYRMTGYEQEDIREYLENSFEEPIWDWGYLALIV